MLTGSEDGVLHMWRPADQPNIKPADKKKVTQACSYTSNTNVSIVSVYSNPSSPVLTVGWVNLYKKFEIEKFTVCGKLILPNKMERHFFNFRMHNWHADLHGFANIFKLPVSNTYKDMHCKFDRK